MNLPSIIKDLIKAQETYDSAAYANLFSETAIVLDEGKKHHGKDKIEQWIKKANAEYKTVMKPIGYSEDDEILKAEISGDFPGSPIILTYHFKLNNDLIESLEIKE